MAGWPAHIASVMTTQTEPVTTWGLEPCESRGLSIAAHVSGRGGARVAPRPTGIGRGKAEVQTPLSSILRFVSYGGRSGLTPEGVVNEYAQSSPAAAPPFARVEKSRLFDACLPRADGSSDCSFSAEFLQPGMNGDLGIARWRLRHG